MTGGAEPNTIPREIADYTIEQGREINRTGSGGRLMWAALKRKLDREDPSYAS